MANSDSLADVGVNALSRYLVALTEQNITPIVFGDAKNYATETVEFTVTDPAENSLEIPGELPSLCKLEFNGTFDETFKLDIVINGNIVSCFKAPYRFILEETKIIEFHVLPVYVNLELIITGFTGTIKASKRVPLEKEIAFFTQYSGRSKFTPLVTDLMVSSDEPIESVTIRVGICSGYETVDSTVVMFDSKMLDAMYTKFTGKQERPKNFAICTIKNKELRFTPYLELKDILVNDVAVNRSTVHYHTYDLFLYGGQSMVVRYAY